MSSCFSPGTFLSVVESMEMLPGVTKAAKVPGKKKKTLSDITKNIITASSFPSFRNYGKNIREGSARPRNLLEVEEISATRPEPMLTLAILANANKQSSHALSLVGGAYRAYRAYRAHPPPCQSHRHYPIVDNRMDRALGNRVPSCE